MTPESLERLTDIVEVLRSARKQGLYEDLTDSATNWDWPDGAGRHLTDDLIVLGIMNPFTLEVSLATHPPLTGPRWLAFVEGGVQRPKLSRANAYREYLDLMGEHATYLELAAMEEGLREELAQETGVLPKELPRALVAELGGLSRDDIERARGGLSQLKPDALGRLAPKLRPTMKIAGSRTVAHLFDPTPAKYSGALMMFRDQPATAPAPSSGPSTTTIAYAAGGAAAGGAAGYFLGSKRPLVAVLGALLGASGGYLLSTE
jgi:hypothetical protein